MISLQTLVSNLDRSRFEPMVLFHRVKNPEIVAALEEKGVPVYDLAETAGDKREAAGEGSPKEPMVGEAALRRLLPGYRLARALREFLKNDSWVMRPLARFFSEHAIDIVHLNNGLRYHRGDLLVTRKLGIPTVCHVRAFQPLTALERFAGKRVQRFLYISRAIAADYERQRISAGRGQVVHNVVSFPAPLSREAKDRVRAEFGWDESRFVALNVGRLVAWKGQDVFLKAIRSAAQELPSLRALVVGAADDNEKSRSFAGKLRDLARGLRIEDKVVFTGFRSDIPALMAAADVVVHSAVKPEPFGRVIIEAMAAGTPVIAANDGGVTDIITQDVNGVLVPPGDEEELAGAIRRLMGDEKLRKRVGEAGREHVRANFCVEKQLRTIQGVYEDLVRKRSAGNVK